MQIKGVSGVRDIAILPAMWRRQVDVGGHTHRPRGARAGSDGLARVIAYISL